LQDILGKNCPTESCYKIFGGKKVAHKIVEIFISDNEGNEKTTLAKKFEPLPEQNSPTQPKIKSSDHQATPPVEMLAKVIIC